MSHLLCYNDTEKRLFWCVGAYVYAQATLPVNATVLEIGGGQDPHPAAQVIVDKFIDDNRHRMMGADFMAAMPLTETYADGSVHDGGVYHPQIVQADVCDLPFSDKSFDFCIAKDVLEHVPDIEQACREISRVAKAGFVDVPRLASEYLWPMDEGIHTWCFGLDEGGLVAHRKQFTSPFGGLLHKVFAESADIQSAWAISRHYFHAALFWQDTLTVRVGEPVTAAWLDGMRLTEDVVRGLV